MKRQSVWTDPFAIILIITIIILLLVAAGILNLGQIYIWLKGVLA